MNNLMKSLGRKGFVLSLLVALFLVVGCGGSSDNHIENKKSALCQTDPSLTFC